MTMIWLLLYLFLSVEKVDAFLPTISFWQRSVSPVFAAIDSSGLGFSPSNSLNQRTLIIGGPGILSYKAIVVADTNCRGAGTAAALLAAPETSVLFPFSFTPAAGTLDTYFTVCAIGKNFVGAWQSEILPTTSLTLRVNTIVPVLQTLSLNYGVTTTTANVVNVALSATHANLNITHFCLKSRIGVSTPVAPLLTDSCWKVIDGNSPNIMPSPSINFSTFMFNIGYTEEIYKVYGWVRSEAGAISQLTSTSGVIGVDKFEISYFPPQAPRIINVLATSSNSPGSPLTLSDLSTPTGSDIYIKWNATDDKPLPSNTISLSYSTDEINYTTIVSGISNSPGSGCTISATYTGCFKWANGSPLPSYFKIRVGVLDSTGLLSYASSPPNNTSIFSIIAGNTDLGLNGSATSAILKTRHAASTNSGQGRFVVRNDGNVYIIDDRGLLTINPFDGLLKKLMPVTGTSTDGALSSATLANPIKMVLDISDNLIIYDYNRIRKIDFATSQVTTIVGGGTSTSSGTSAGNFLINPIGGSFEHMLFTVLPNGNIWFQTNDDFLRSRNDGAKIRIYNATDQKVYTLIPTGIGSLEDSGFDPSGYAIYNFGIAFNPMTSAVTKIRSRSIIPTSGGHWPRSVSYNPSNGGAEGPHVPFVNYWSDDNTFTTISGEMYNVDHYQQNGIHKYDSSTNSWARILGTGAKGQCDDGTDALSCNVDVNDLFVSATGQVYFVDRNRIRVIDSSNKIRTLFGQSLSFGNGELATSARLNRVLWIDRANDGRIILADDNEFALREFTIGGQISLIAGNGTDAGPNTTSLASIQPVSVKYWGGSYPLSVDPTNANIFYTRSGSDLSKLNRSTGKWEDFAGGGGTAYYTADGLAGSQVSLQGYPMGVHGFNGTQVLRHLHEWNGSIYVNAFLKLYSITNGQQTHFAGLLGDNLDSIDNCSAGSTLANCKVPANHNSLTKAQWDNSNSRWLIAQIGSSKIRTAVTGGQIGDLVNLPRGIQSFYYIVKTAGPTIYYCSGGRVYKYMMNTATESALYWPSATLSCDGYSMSWDPSRNSIIFPIQQNNIAGIAEIIDL